MSHRRVLVIGAGGHGKVVISILQAAGRTVDAIVDDDLNFHNVCILGVPVLGKIGCAAQFREHEAVIAIGDNAVRRAIARRFDLDWTVAVHPSAFVHSTVRLGVGTVVCAGAIVQPDASIGSHTIINTGASVDHDCGIGDFVHIAPGVHLAGGVRIAEGAFLGIGAGVLPNVCVGEWAVLGAGAMAIRDVGACSVAVGVPATRVHRTVGPKNGTQ